MARKRRAAAGGILLGLAGAAALAQQGGHEMAFWFDDEAAARAAGATRFEEHPCGAVAVARVTRMPDEASALDTEIIAEYGPGRRELRRWAVPVDAMPAGLGGERLLIALGEGHFWIGTDGGIAAAPGAAAREPVEAPGQCGTPAGQEGSDYAQCGALSDAATGARRILWYQGVCT